MITLISAVVSHIQISPKERNVNVDEISCTRKCWGKNVDCCIIYDCKKPEKS